MNLLGVTVSDGVLHGMGKAKVGSAGLVEGCADPCSVASERFASARGASAPALRWLVDVVEPLGHEAVVHGRLADDSDTVVVARLPSADEPRAGDVLELTFAPEDMHVFDRESGARVSHATSGLLLIIASHSFCGAGATDPPRASTGRDCAPRGRVSGEERA